MQNSGQHFDFYMQILIIFIEILHQNEKSYLINENSLRSNTLFMKFDLDYPQANLDIRFIIAHLFLLSVE